MNISKLEDACARMKLSGECETWEDEVCMLRGLYCPKVIGRAYEDKIVDDVLDIERKTIGDRRATTKTTTYQKPPN